ncbi:MAG TPA: LysR substrate-binding domain-containing protein, partial [Mycobacteriales bacterium]|nr:LysR substrate-binding domain-containing protein [Mycobacteriales bacterium]
MHTAVDDAAERGDQLDPRRLLIFREVARRGSLSAAAAALGWTQPAVGQHLRRLERDVGLPLALRTARGVRLTDAGEALLEHADAVASRLFTAAEEMRALRTLQAGRLRLAAFPSGCATLVPAAIARLARLAPGLEVRLTELEPPEARDAVLAGEADLALLFQHPGDGARDQHRDLTGITLLDDPVLAVLPTGHRLAAATVDPGVQLAYLAGERWVAGCPRCRTHLAALAAAAGFQPDIRHSTDDYVVVQNLVAEGLAVALLPLLALTAARDPRVAAMRVAGDPFRRISLVH